MSSASSYACSASTPDRNRLVAMRPFENGSGWPEPRMRGSRWSGTQRHRLACKLEQGGVQVGLAVGRLRHVVAEDDANSVFGRVLTDHVDCGRLQLDQERAGRRNVVPRQRLAQRLTVGQ